MRVSARSIRTAILLVIAVMAVNLVPAIAADAPFKPNRPIEFICFFSPGGGSGVFSEMAGSIMEKEKIVSVPMPRIYKPGGGSAVGMAYMAEKKGNPYYLGSTTNPCVLTPLVAKSKNTITYRDFTPIAILAFDEQVIVVKYDSPYKTIKDLVAAAKANPKKVKFGGASVGGTESMIVASLSKAAKVEFNFVAFSGGGEVNAALLGGHIDAMCSNPTEMLPQIEGKTMRMLASASEKRVLGKEFKNIPTLKESGYNVVFNTFRGLWATGGVSPEVVKYYENAAKKLSQSAAFKKYIADNNMTPTFMGSAQSLKYYEAFEKRSIGLLMDLGVIKK